MLEEIQRVRGEIPDGGAADYGVPRDLSSALTAFAQEYGDDDREAIGVVDGCGQLLLIENLADEPTRRFEAGDRWLEVMSTARAVFHTHPTGQPWPSPRDQAQQIATGVPWAIVPRGGEPFWFGTHEVEAGLWERPFRWGSTDCYGFARRAFSELFGIEIGNHVRRRGFSKVGEPLFENGLRHEGFLPVEGDLEAAQPGDGILVRKGDESPFSHCLVVVDPGWAAHHRSTGAPFAPTYRPRRIRLERLHGISRQVVRRA